MYRQTYPDHPGMHNDQHTRTAYRRNPTFFERVGNSLYGILIGFLLLLVAGYLLYWNEGRAVQTARSLEEGLSVVVPLKTTDVAFDNNNGKLVHFTGALHTQEMVLDPVYHIAVPAVKLRRKVEIYQWVEHETKREYDNGNGETREEITYSYTQEWKTELIRSSSFDNSVGHDNPTSVSVSSATHSADRVQVGSFVLSSGLMDKITNYKQLAPSHIGQPSDPIKLYGGALYHSFNPASPQVGDLRITFEYAGLGQDSTLGPPDTVSIVARQINEKLLPYQTEAGDTIELLYFGDMSPKEIFGKEQAMNTMLTWAVRFGGWLLMFIGFGCMTSIVTTLVDWLPIVRDLVAMGVTTLNLALSISFSLTIIAIGWIRFRPLFGLSVLAVAAVPLFASKIFPRNRSSSYSRDRYA